MSCSVDRWPLIAATRTNVIAIGYVMKKAAAVGYRRSYASEEYRVNYWAVHMLSMLDMTLRFMNIAGLRMPLVVTVLEASH